jgi:hypothetical protein
MPTTHRQGEQEKPSLVLRQSSYCISLQGLVSLLCAGELRRAYIFSQAPASHKAL